LCRQDTHDRAIEVAELAASTTVIVVLNSRVADRRDYVCGSVLLTVVHHDGEPVIVGLRRERA